MFTNTKIHVVREMVIARSEIIVVLEVFEGGLVCGCDLSVSKPSCSSLRSLVYDMAVVAGNDR